MQVVTFLLIISATFVIRNCIDATTKRYSLSKLIYPRRLGMSNNLLKPDASKILSVVPQENAFRFCTADGVYTNIEAMSLDDFAEVLGRIDASILILFHYPRGDFQAWIKNSIGDSELADKMCFIPLGISGESLRQELLKMVQKRVSELKAVKSSISHQPM